MKKAMAADASRNLSEEPNGPTTDIDGIVLLDKPLGLSSHTACRRVQRLLGARKAGHTGTLDPLATGLLPVALGEATKFTADLLDADKGYLATLALGVRTTTGDGEGEVAEVRPVGFDRAELDVVLSRFTGSIRQVPPMHSAIKQGGVALYELARAGVEVPRAARAVRIDGLRVVDWSGDRLVLDVGCSKGTYIRVLAEDIGQALGCGAHLAALRRTAVGTLTINDAVRLEELEGETPAARRRHLLPVDALIASLVRVDLDHAQALRLLQGRTVASNTVVWNPAPPDAKADVRLRAYGPDGALLGVVRRDERGDLIVARLLQTAERIDALAATANQPVDRAAVPDRQDS